MLIQLSLFGGFLHSVSCFRGGGCVSDISVKFEGRLKRRVNDKFVFFCIAHNYLNFDVQKYACWTPLIFGAELYIREKKYRRFQIHFYHDKNIFINFVTHKIILFRCISSIR